MARTVKRGFGVQLNCGVFLLTHQKTGLSAGFSLAYFSDGSIMSVGSVTC